MEFAEKKMEQMQTVDDVIAAMSRRLLAFEEKKDHRAIFQRVYLLMTKELKHRLASGFFMDPIWMERVLIKFACYYFKAADAYESGQPCAPAWNLAFGQAVKKQGFVLQDALLGINAHINNDLSLVLYDILTEDNAWPDARVMLRRRQDHERINEVLGDLVDIAQDALSHYQAPFIRAVDYLAGRRDEPLFSLILAHCRATVWHNTELLLDAPDKEKRDVFRQQIETDAYTIGLKVVYSPAFRLLKKVFPFAVRNRWL